MITLMLEIVSRSISEIYLVSDQGFWGVVLHYVLQYSLAMEW